MSCIITSIIIDIIIDANVVYSWENFNFSTGIKKALNIASKIVAIVLLLFIILVLILSIPAVQTNIGKKVTKRLNNDFKTNINVGRVGLQFNGDVELKDIYIEDYKKDTLINIQELNTSILGFRNLYNGKLVFGDIDIEELTFNVKTYLGETDTNLDVFVAKFDADNPRDKKSEFLMSSSDVSIIGGKFMLSDENKETVKILHFDDLNINATNFLINGSDVSARINTLAFNDSRGFVMKNMSTDFSYTLQDMTFGNLNIKTDQSALKGNVMFTYKREDLQYFVDRVNLKANFTESDIALNELNIFYNEFGVREHAKITGQFSGTLNNLSVQNLKVNTSQRTKIYGDIVFKNLFSKAEGDFAMHGTFGNLSSNYSDLKAMLPNIIGESIPTIFNKFGNFTIVGDSNLTASSIKADIEITADIGIIDTNLEIKKINDIDNATYLGNVIFQDFDLGMLLEDTNLGITSFNVDVDGFGFDKEKINTQIIGAVTSLVYNAYEYNDLEVSGILKNKIFNGKLVSNDENLNLNFNGLADFSKEINTFDFVADVQYANLKALNFVKTDSLSIFKGIVDMKMQGTNIDNAIGDISFKKTNYTNKYDEYYFEDFAITSKFEDKIRYISVNSPDIIEGQLSGEFVFRDIVKLLENSLGSIYTNYEPHKIRDKQYIDFNFKIYNKIVEVFYNDLKLSANSFIKGHAESDEKGFKLTFKSPKIELRDYFVKDIELQLDSKNPLFNTYVEVDSISTKYYNASKFNLINVTLNDTLFMRSEFTGGKHNSDIYNLSFYHTINENNKSVVGFKKSDITFKGNTWFINEARDRYHKIAFNKALSEVALDRFVMSHNNEEIKLSGALRDSTYKDIKLNFKNVDLTKIIPSVDSLKISGNVNGKLDILQNNGVYIPNSAVIVDDFKVNDYRLGTFDAKIIGNQSLTNYLVDVKIKNAYTQSFSAKGNIDVSATQSYIDVDMEFDEFNLAPLNPLLAGVLSDVRGLAFGQARASGSLKKPDITGELLLKKAGLGVPYLNVDYSFKDDSKVALNNQSFNFNNLELTDTTFKTKGILNGSLSHTNLSKWRLNLNFSSPRLLVLNTPETEDALYYGTGFLGGSASIVGPTEQLVINVTGQTERGTVFKIPLNDAESFGDNSYIHFLSPEEKQARKEGEELVFESVQGLELDFDLDVNENAEIELVLDKVSGSNIKGRGVGGMLVEINTNGKFNIYGDFSVFEGVYNFYYGGIVQKEFDVEPGGSIAWEGSPTQARIDIKAVYKTRANPSPLLDNPINRSIPVNVEINLTGELRTPEPDFNFTFPNVSSTIKSELDYRLESKEDRDNQALYLLTTGSFSNSLNDLNVTGTISERLNGLISEIFANSDDKFQLGVNYEIGQTRPDYKTDDRLGVTLQTKLSERVLINGKVGVPIGGASETVIAGDVEIDFLLNEEGTLTAKVFNRENSIRNFGEEIGYTQGVGISYNVEFDTFKELIHKLFKKKEIEEEENDDKFNEDNGKPKEEPLPEFVGFKTSSTDE